MHSFILLIFLSMCSNVFAKEYVGIDICSKFNREEFIKNLKDIQGNGKFEKSRTGNNTYEFAPYVIVDQKYTVEMEVERDRIYQIWISPMHDPERSKLKIMLEKKYGYGERKIETLDHLGIDGVRLESHYLKLGDPEIGLFVHKESSRGISTSRGETVVYECTAIANDIKAQKEKQKEIEKEKMKGVKMTF